MKTACIRYCQHTPVLLASPSEAVGSKIWNALQEDGSITGDSADFRAAQNTKDRASAARIEKQLVKEFKQRLDFNIGNVSQQYKMPMLSSEHSKIVGWCICCGT